MKILRIFFCIVAAAIIIFLLINLFYECNPELPVPFSFNKNDLSRNILEAFIALIIVVLLFYFTLDFSVGESGLSEEERGEK